MTRFRERSLINARYKASATFRACARSTFYIPVISILPLQKMRYRIGTEEVGETFQRRDFPSPPPSYNMNRYIIAPPEYCDALQDVLLDSGHGSGETAGEKLCDTAFKKLQHCVLV